jgi:abortive infection bacteriophage resistance protein
MSDETSKILELSLLDLESIPEQIDVESYDKIKLIKRCFPLIDHELMCEPDRRKTLKPPIYINKMIEKLQNEYNITFTADEKIKAETFLLKVNYYRFSIYTKIMNRTCSFSEIKLMYDFDCFMRETISILLAPVEVYIKTTLVYFLCNNYEKLIMGIYKVSPSIHPSLAYLDKRIYKTEEVENGRVDYMISELADEVYSRRKQELSVRHHIQYYGGNIPMWVLIEQMTLGKVSTLITSLQRQIRKGWTDEYFPKEGPKLIPSWVHTLVVLRNTCAHGGRLYGRKFIYSPIFPKTDSFVGTLNSEELDAFKPTLFAGLLVMKNIYTSLDNSDVKRWNKFIFQISKHMGRPDSVVKGNDIGFPDDWNDLLKIERSL